MELQFNFAVILGFSISGIIAVVGMWMLYKGGSLWWAGRQLATPPVPPVGGLANTPVPPKNKTKHLPVSGVQQQMQCHRCSAPLRVDAQFCPNCGAARVLGDRYHIVQVLGRGGMGAVYLAEDNRLSKKWAIKEMTDAGITQDLDRNQAIEAFEQEASLLARLDHTNLPKVADFFSQDSSHYLVMDYIEGKTLLEMLDNRPTPFAEIKVVEWGLQMCNVLAYLHGQIPPVIFRDLKPANIMITQRGMGVKLIDFGIARLFKSGQKGGDTIRLGTPGYAAPEQYSGKGQSGPVSDIYALGVTMHQLLTQHDPTHTPFQQLPPIKKMNPAASTPVIQIISRAIQNDASKRYQSATEMKQALMAVNGRKSTDTHPE